MWEGKEAQAGIHPMANLENGCLGTWANSSFDHCQRLKQHSQCCLAGKRRRFASLTHPESSLFLVEHRCTYPEPYGYGHAVDFPCMLHSRPEMTIIRSDMQQAYMRRLLDCLFSFLLPALIAFSQINLVP